MQDSWTMSKTKGQCIHGKLCLIDLTLSLKNGADRESKKAFYWKQQKPSQNQGMNFAVFDRQLFVSSKCPINQHHPLLTCPSSVTRCVRVFP
jgi:hypothetical protein